QHKNRALLIRGATNVEDDFFSSALLAAFDHFELPERQKEVRNYFAPLVFSSPFHLLYHFQVVFDIHSYVHKKSNCYKTLDRGIDLSRRSILGPHLCRGAIEK
ncbi:unnamed protein product, partial [Amoebophrya sp. A120]